MNALGRAGKRTWPIAPDPETLRARWEALLGVRSFSGVSGDARSHRDEPAVPAGRSCPGAAHRAGAVETPAGPILRYGYRPFDRQDARGIVHDLLGVRLLEDCACPETGELTPVVVVSENGPCYRAVGFARTSPAAPS